MSSPQWAAPAMRSAPAAAAPAKRVLLLPSIRGLCSFWQGNSKGGAAGRCHGLEEAIPARMQSLLASPLWGELPLSALGADHADHQRAVILLPDERPPASSLSVGLEGGGRWSARKTTGH